MRTLLNAFAKYAMKNAPSVSPVYHACLALRNQMIQDVRTASLVKNVSLAHPVLHVSCNIGELNRKLRNERTFWTCMKYSFLILLQFNDPDFNLF